LGKKAGGVKIKPSQSSVFKKAVVQYRNRFIVEAWKGMFEIEGGHRGGAEAWAWLQEQSRLWDGCYLWLRALKRA